eukprot:Hpha_TRINITY_DN15939_c1_g2::TRINITY_DN15939_c1_g2_i1::g.71695::m.71695
MAAGLRPCRQVGDTAMVRVHFLLRAEAMPEDNEDKGFDLAEAHAEFNSKTALPFDLRLPLCASSAYDGDPNRISNCIRFTLAQLVRCRIFVCRRVHAICIGARAIQSWWRKWLARRTERKATALQNWQADDERIRTKARERIEREQKAEKRARCETHRKEAQARQRAATTEYGKHNITNDIRERAIDRVWAEKSLEYKQNMARWINRNIQLEKKAAHYFRDMKRVFGRTWAGTGDDIERAEVDLGYIKSLIELRRLRANRPRIRFHTVPMKELRATATAIMTEDRKAQEALEAELEKERERDRRQSSTLLPGDDRRRRRSSDRSRSPSITPPHSLSPANAGVSPTGRRLSPTATSPPHRLPAIPPTVQKPVVPPRGGTPEPRHSAPISNSPEPLVRRTAATPDPQKGGTLLVGGHEKDVDLSGLRESFSAATVRLVEDAFTRCDTDHDGHISRDEMVAFLEGLYLATGVPMPCDDALRREVVDTFRRNDVDRNGRLSPEEVVGFLPRSHFREGLSHKSGKHRAPAALPQIPSPTTRKSAIGRHRRGQGDMDDGDDLTGELHSILHGR